MHVFEFAIYLVRPPRWRRCRRGGASRCCSLGTTTSASTTAGRCGRTTFFGLAICFSRHLPVCVRALRPSPRRPHAGRCVCSSLRIISAVSCKEKHPHGAPQRMNGPHSADVHADRCPLCPPMVMPVLHRPKALVPRPHHRRPDRQHHEVSVARGDGGARDGARAELPC